MEKVIELNRWHKEHVRSEEELRALFNEVSTLYGSEPYPDYEQRVERILRLKAALISCQDELSQAMSEDYGRRSEFDSVITDLLPSIEHIKYTLKHLKKWMRPQRRRAGALLFPSKVEVQYQPVGVVGVIVPWNFPVFLSIAPIITALAAGNRVMVKLSEYTHHTNQVLSRVFSSVENHVFAIEGKGEIASYFSQLPFNHILFTGSSKVGRLVAQAAAKNLTPVTLELGGKSPVIIGEDFPLDKAVDMVLMGKTINAGQVCVAPDYVLLPKGKERQFVRLYLEKFNGLSAKMDSSTYIINDEQFLRLNALVQDARNLGGRVHAPEHKIEKGRFMVPHLITEVRETMKVAKEEIFGPVLPVMGYRHVNEAIAYVNQRPRPLALYLMTHEKTLMNEVKQHTHSGGLAINDTVLHVAVQDAPFGGIGQSGIGQYHGFEGFQRLSHGKTVLWTPAWLRRSRLVLQFQSLAKIGLKRLFIR